MVQATMQTERIAIIRYTKWWPKFQVLVCLVTSNKISISCLRWKKILYEQQEQWLGVFSNRVWILQQEDNFILYKVQSSTLNKLGEGEQYYNGLLRNYFQLDVNIEESYEKWSQVDPYFKAATRQFYGIRILKQDITENIFSFICSSNNHITRYTY